MNDEDRVAELFQQLVEAALCKPRLDPFGVYGATVLAVRASGNVDVIADNPDISYVNDCQVYPGIPGLVVTPFGRSLIEKGARCLLLWRDGNKQLKTILAFASNPEDSVKDMTLQVREYFHLTVPDFTVNGDTTTQRLYSNGDGPPFPIPGPALGGPDPAVTGCTGSDMAFTLTMKAASGNMPPPTPGILAVVAFGGGLWSTALHPVISAGAGAGALGLSVTSLGFGLVISCSVPPVPGLTISCSVHTIGAD